LARFSGRLEGSDRSRQGIDPSRPFEFSVELCCVGARHPKSDRNHEA
jgi:hypothetical protein